MTKDEINEEACEHCNWAMCSVCENRTCDNTHLATLKCREWRDRRAGYYCGAESREKRIAELERVISVLLSCKNCPENKGGYICQKEYEDKCLAQKIQYIKELQEEIVELEAQIEKMKCCENCKYSDTEGEGHIICCKGHFFECLSNKIFDHTTKEKDYWEIKEND